MPPSFHQTFYGRGTTMLNATLGLLSRGRPGQVKEVCRICRELADLEPDRLCADCARIKAKIRWHITHQPADGDSSKQALQCKRLGCLCPPCGRRIFDLHPFHSDSAEAQGREVHFHSRCHALWLEVARGVDDGPSQDQEST
jgi:hypothetical protein